MYHQPDFRGHKGVNLIEPTVGFVGREGSIWPICDSKRYLPLGEYRGGFRGSLRIGCEVGFPSPGRTRCSSYVRRKWPLLAAPSSYVGQGPLSPWLPTSRLGGNLSENHENGRKLRGNSRSQWKLWQTSSGSRGMRWLPWSRWRAWQIWSCEECDVIDFVRKGVRRQSLLGRRE